MHLDSGLATRPMHHVKLSENRLLQKTRDGGMEGPALGMMISQIDESALRLHVFMTLFPLLFP